MYKQLIYDEVEKLTELGVDSCRFIWNHPEVGGTEVESYAYVKGVMESQGFRIVTNEKVKNAFYAEYGSGSPVIAIIGEYDALPGLSQKISAQMEPVEAGKPGHGCGHNLLGSASMVAAIAVKNHIESGELQGTVRFYGCPEEELLIGKVKMIYYKMFEGCDVALSWHPMSTNQVFDEAYLASAAAKFHFKGISSHAGFAPERGRSALDAVELMNVGCNYLREHVIDHSRIHYTTDNYGYPPNIVPDKASAWYCVRAPHINDVQDILERIHKVAKGAAMMTETEVEMELISGCCEVNPNHTFADLTYTNMQQADMPQYTEEELVFAKELQKTVNPEVLKRDEAVYNAEGTGMDLGIQPRTLYKVTPLNASSDSGDVSQIMPMNLFSTACWPIGAAPHTWQATASNGSSLGEKGMVYAAKILAGCAFDLCTKPNLVKQIQKEFEDNKPNYKPMFEEV